MNWLRNAIRRWLNNERNYYEKPSLVASQPVEESPEQVVSRFTVLRAINGYVIQIGKHKHNPHGPDWTFSNYVVAEGEDLIDAVKTCITLGALSK
jgi:hypothetical protein